LNILLAASEVVPYAKTGGLADVAGALPKALTRLGQTVRVVMPRYSIESIIRAGHPAPFEIDVPFNFTVRRTRVYVDDTGPARVYFIDAPEYFDRARLYGEPDDPQRFAFFSRAVVELARASDERYDIIHLNDWMTGLVPSFLKSVYPDDPVLSGVSTVFTIHNLAFHGGFDPALLASMGLPDWIFRTENGIEFYGAASTLKSGLVFSDAITTVSPSYIKEIQTPEYGERLDGLLRSRASDLYGILNGVDYDEWNPETDPYIARNYGARDLTGKAECKRDLLKTFRLADDPGRPLIGCISRLSDQKGFDLILDVIGQVLDRGVNFVLLGSGADSYERAFQALKDSRPSQVGVYLGYSNEIAHKIEAGADIFLMPSRFEPCGLNQMYSLKYGTVPVVRAAGGLEDTIENFDRTTGRGNGFKFAEYSPARLLEKIYEALLTFADQRLWNSLMMNGMAADFSWNKSAERYIEMYRRIASLSAAA
jgi:starch synthase